MPKTFSWDTLSHIYALAVCSDAYADYKAKADFLEGQGRRRGGRGRHAFGSQLTWDITRKRMSPTRYNLKALRLAAGERDRDERKAIADIKHSTREKMDIRRRAQLLISGMDLQAVT